MLILPGSSALSDARYQLLAAEVSALGEGGCSARRCMLMR